MKWFKFYFPVNSGFSCCHFLPDAKILSVFNFNELVADLDTKTPDLCDCQNSNFCYQTTGHIITENLKIISDS